MTTTESKQAADRVLAKLVKMESEGLRDALGAGDYSRVRIWSKQLAKTLNLVNSEMEARGE